MYYQRRANLKDVTAIAPLWEAFLLERSQYDPSMVLKPQFDYEAYVKNKLNSPLIYGFLVEYGEQKQIVGFLFVYVYDETPRLEGEPNSPFEPRRMGGAIGMYVKAEHRKPEAIILLVEAALSLAEDLKISDIDLLISREQTGVHRLLERFGFTPAAIQYTKHYQRTDQDLIP